MKHATRPARRVLRDESQTPGQFATSQRARILQAVAELVCEHDTLTPRTNEILTRADVSARTFRVLFAGPEQCVLAAFDDAVTLAAAHARAARCGHTDWLARLRSATAASLELADQHPAFTRLCLVHTPLGPPPLHRRCRKQTDMLARALAHGAPQSEAVRPWTANAAIGAAFGTLHARLSQNANPLRPLHGELMALLVLPTTADHERQRAVRPRS